MDETSDQRLIGGIPTHIGDCYIWSEILYLDSSTEYREYLTALPPQPAAILLQPPITINRDHTAGHPRGRAFNRLLLLLTIVLILLVWLERASSQTSLEEVHIAPRLNAAVRPDSTSDSSLDKSARPLKANVDLVLVPVTIVDPLNRVVQGLEKDNFQVYENKQLQPIRSFSSEDIPVSLGVIFDTSGSMRSKIERARQAVMEFFKTANPQDEFFVVTFADKPEETSDFTTSIEEIEGKLVFTMPKGRTALLDAIYMGVSKMRQAQYAKKALLIISDGGDNHSKYTERELRGLVKESDVMIYGIGLYDRYFSTEEERLGPELLSDICQLTGGRTFTVENPNDLTDVAAKIGAELRNQYVIGYRPQNRPNDGKWRKIKIRLMPPKGLPPLHAYAKQGYYAHPE